MVSYLGNNLDMSFYAIIIALHTIYHPTEYKSIQECINALPAIQVVYEKKHGKLTGTACVNADLRDRIKRGN